MAFTNVLGGSNRYPELRLRWAPTSAPAAAAPSWVDITSRLRGWAWGYGRSDVIGRFEAGHGTVLLDNRDRALDPSYDAGAWFGNIKPRKVFELVARWDAVEYPVFKAYAQAFPQAYPAAGSDSVVRVELADAYWILNKAELPVGFTRPVELSGERIAAVLEEIGVPSALRDLDDGTVEVAALEVTEAGTSGLAHASDVEASEFGQLFVAKDGKVTFHDRHRRLNAATLHTFSDAAASTLRYSPGIEPTFDDTYRWNRILIGGPSSEAAVGSGLAENATSVAEDHPIVRSESTLLASGGERQVLAEYELALFEEPVLRVADLPLNGARSPDDMWPVILDLEISDQVALVVFGDSADPMALTQNVEGIHHQCQPGGPWTTRVATSAADTNTYWQLENVTSGEIDSTFAIAP